MTDDASQRHPAIFDLPDAFSDPSQAAAVILPVPYDLTCSWKRGAAAGPAAIVDASQYIELYDIETDSEPYRRGIATDAPVTCTGSAAELADRVAARVAAVVDRHQLPIVLGGEHSVTIGAVRAVADRVPNLSVLQIDAHGDTREQYMGDTHNHACVMARARERCSIVQVGIRSLDPSELPSLDRSRVFFAPDHAGAADRSWMDRAVDLLTDDVYVTIDLDAFDPSVLPATGTPEPGGLSWAEVNDLLARVTARRSVRAFDVVELCPCDVHHASAFTAAKLVYRMLAMVFAGQKRRSDAEAISQSICLAAINARNGTDTR